MKTVKIIFSDGEYLVTPCKHPKLGKGFEIDYTQMYKPPILSFALMKEISHHFGTEDIDFDDVSIEGCETCDYGSKYGFRIQVYNATKNNPFSLGRGKK